MRNDYKDEFQKNYNVKLGFMSFFENLRNWFKFSAINSEFKEKKLFIKIIIILVSQSAQIEAWLVLEKRMKCPLRTEKYI